MDCEFVRTNGHSSSVEYLGHVLDATGLQDQDSLGCPSATKRQPTAFFPGVTELLWTLYAEVSNKAEAAESVVLSGQNMEMDRTMQGSVSENQGNTPDI